MQGLEFRHYFFTSVLHNQYHTPQDESENINYKKLYKMTEWMYRTSWKVANESQRPGLIPNFFFRKIEDGILITKFEKRNI